MIKTDKELNMEALSIEGTAKTPSVKFDGQEGVIEIKGRSIPANSIEFYKPLVEWLEEYRNESLVTDVFNRCDCIVVPSIWDENSPLVIHEAQQARLPVITAEHGGMAGLLE